MSHSLLWKFLQCIPGDSCEQLDTDDVCIPL